MTTQIAISIGILVCLTGLFWYKKIPMGVSAMMASMAMAAFGIISQKDVVTNFGNDSIFLVIGAMIAGQALVETGVITVVGKAICGTTLVTKNERRFLVIITALACVLSSFMQNTGTVAILMPIIAAAAAEPNGKIKYSHILMPVGIAAGIGGVCSLVGTSTNVLGQELLAGIEGASQINFTTLTWATLPVAIAMLIYFATVGHKIMQSKSFNDFEETVTALPDNTPQKIGLKGWLAIVIVIGCYALLSFGVLKTGFAGVLMMCLLILTGCISFGDAIKSVSWNTIATLGGIFGFAAGLKNSGTLEWFAGLFLNTMGSNATPYGVFLVFLLVSIIATQFMSNTAVYTILGPVGATVAQSIGMDPMIVIVAVLVGVSQAHATPVGAAQMTMTVAGGYSFKHYILEGFLLVVIVSIVYAIWLPLLYGLH